MLELILIRKHYTLTSTLGELFQIDREQNKNIHLAYTLEDAVTVNKHYGESAIPAGKYKVVNTYSNSFRRTLPLLLDVPNYKFVRIHAGNSNKDTLGCILIGANQDVKTEKIWNCAIVVNLLIDLIDKHDECILEIV
jgi:hypothetical protein